jgi:hypothetical protein
MIYFLILPLWLVGLAICAGLAFFKPARVPAIYLSLAGTGAVVLSLLTSTLVLLVWAQVADSGSGLWLAAGYITGVLGGGGAGAGLGALLAWRLTRKRPERPAVSLP